MFCKTACSYVIIYVHKLNKTTAGSKCLGFDELLGIVESFCNRASQVAFVTVETISTSAGISSFIYVKHGDAEYRDVLSDLFQVEDAYTEWQADFILFKLNKEYLAAGTYTPGSAAVAEDEVVKFTKVLLTELDSCIKRQEAI